VNTLQTARKADTLPSLPSQPRDLKQKARLRKDPGLCFVLTMSMLTHTGDPPWSSEPARPRRTLSRCPSHPSRIHLPARPPWPSQFVPSEDSPYTAPSRITLVNSKAKALCGISRVPGGDSLAICRCDQGNILVDRHAAEEKTVKDLVLELIDLKIQELEKKGILPKGK
jgi:hypothetical protein